MLVDPEIPLDATLIPSPSPRPKNPVFDDEKKSKVRCEGVTSSSVLTASLLKTQTDCEDHLSGKYEAAGGGGSQEERV